MTKYHNSYPYGRPAWAGLLNAIWQQIDQKLTDMDDGTHAHDGINIDAGTLDGVTVGASAPSTGDFSVILASGDLNVGSCLKVTLGVQQLIATVTSEKVQYDFIRLDNHDAFDLDNHRFTPARAGFYLIVQTIGCFASATTKEFRSHIYKNGSVYSTQAWVSIGTNYQRVSHPTVVQANGSTDYFEGYFYNGDSGSIALGGDELLAIRIF